MLAWPHRHALRGCVIHTTLVLLVALAIAVLMRRMVQVSEAPVV